MANNLTAWKAQVWASMIQEHLYEAFVWAKISTTKFEWQFDWSDTIHFPRIAKIVTADLASSYDAPAIQDVVETDETFVLDVRKAFAVKISNEDYKEIKVNPNEVIFKDAAEAFARDYDTEIMWEYANAWITIDDWDMESATNWWAWNSIILWKSNIYDMITAITEKLNIANVWNNWRFLVLSPSEIRLLEKSPDLIRSTDYSDNLITWWFMWTINNVSIFYSNNIQTSWTQWAADWVKHILAWQWTPICFAANIKPSVEITESQYRDDFVNLMKSQTKFWVKTFFSWAQKLIDLQIKY